MATLAIFYSGNPTSSKLFCKVEGGCTCSQVSPKSATCCKMFNSMNNLQHCPNIVPTTLLQNLPLAIRAAFWLHSPCNIRKRCCVANASTNVPCVAAALLFGSQIFGLQRRLDNFTLPTFSTKFLRNVINPF